MVNKLKRWNFSFKIHLLALIISLVLVIISLYLPVIVKTKEELKEVKLGLPLHFIIQDQSRYDPPFPYQMRFYSILENPTKIFFLKLILSVFLVFIVVDGGLILLVRVSEK